LLELRAPGHKPVAASEGNYFLVRIREKGYPQQLLNFPTLEEAEHTAKRIETERHTGLYKDHTRGRRVTLAEIIRRYYLEKCPDHKGSWSAIRSRDSTSMQAGILKTSTPPGGSPSTRPARIRRIHRVGLEWINRGLAEIPT